VQVELSRSSSGEEAARRGEPRLFPMGFGLGRRRNGGRRSRRRSAGADKPRGANRHPCSKLTPKGSSARCSEEALSVGRFEPCADPTMAIALRRAPPRASVSRGRVAEGEASGRGAVRPFGLTGMGRNGRSRRSARKLSASAASRPRGRGRPPRKSIPTRLGPLEEARGASAASRRSCRFEQRAEGFAERGQLLAKPFSTSTAARARR